MKVVSGYLLFTQKSIFSLKIEDLYNLDVTLGSQIVNLWRFHLAYDLDEARTVRHVPVV